MIYIKGKEYDIFITTFQFMMSCVILQVLFSNLEKLELLHLHELKEIWHHRFPHGSFSYLRILKVEGCGSLLNIIPCHLIQSFKNLKEIKVIFCLNLKHVFGFQGCDTYGEILPKLEILELEDLNKPKGIYATMRIMITPKAYEETTMHI